MAEFRFACTACGQCCYGWLPLTLKEALERADRFPLALSLTPVKQSRVPDRSLEAVGTKIRLTGKKDVTLLVAPIAFIPPSMPCPELMSDNRCGVHNEKPLRCRTMPFYPLKDEGRQADMLVPRPGWLCSTGDDAPVVYKDNRILDRADFDRERNAMVEEAPIFRRYSDLAPKHNPALLMQIAQAADRAGGRVIVSLLSLLRYDRSIDLPRFASLQAPVLEHWRQKTAGDVKSTEYQAYYGRALSELERYR